MGEKLDMSAGEPGSSVLPSPNEARCCMKHFLSSSLSLSWRSRRVKQLSVARDFIILQKQRSFTGPGNDAVSQRVNEATWQMSRELHVCSPVGENSKSEDSHAERRSRE